MSVLFIISSHIYRPSLLYFAPNFACIVFLHNSITKSPIIENFANIVYGCCRFPVPLDVSLKVALALLLLFKQKLDADQDPS